MSAGPEAEIALNPERVAALIAAGSEPVDVRRRHQWEGGRLAGARNIEMNELPRAPLPAS